jgi:hypothetical protein
MQSPDYHKVTRKTTPLFLCFTICEGVRSDVAGATQPVRCPASQGDRGGEGKD